MLVLMYMGVDVVMMVIRRFVEVLQCLYHHTDTAVNLSQYQTPKSRA